MKSYSETGNAKNVANLEDLIAFVLALGIIYNPVRNALKVVSLNALLTAARSALTSVKNAANAFFSATNEREIAFANIRSFTTRILNALDSTEASEQLVNDARTINRKIQGKRAKKIEVPPPPVDNNAAPEMPAAKHISASQQSYDSLIDHFNKLVILLASEPLYVPNENDLKTAQLNTYLNTLKTTNSAVITSYANYCTALTNRDNLLYAKKTGLVDITMDVKKYVKSVFSATSDQYRNIAHIKFTRPKKK